MEEIYVIKLRGLPPPTTPSSSSDSEGRDAIYDAVLGLGFVHFVLGLVAVVLGALGLVLEPDTERTGAGVWCGSVFSLTGVAAIAASRKRRKMRLAFGASAASLLFSAAYLSVACLAVSGTTTRIGGNAVIAALLEAAVSLLSMCAAARILWPRLWLSMRCPDHSTPKRKVIVFADVLESGPPGRADAARHISPNCVISFKRVGGDPQREESARRVEEYVRNGCVWGVPTESDCSSFDEDDDATDFVTSENFKNETVDAKRNDPCLWPDRRPPE